MNTRIHFSSIDSTNQWAKTNLHLLNRSEITVVSADTQKDGRGRFNRQWFSDSKQNLTASFCFFTTPNQIHLQNCAQLASLSVVETLEAYGFQPRLKWPNDVLLSGKKVAGVLCEAVQTGDPALCIIVGIGLNLHLTEELIREIDQPATSLLIESGQHYVIEEVTERLTDIFTKNLEIFKEKGFTPFFERYSSLLEKEQMTFHHGNHLCEGTFHSLNNDGSLNLKLPSGEIQRFF